MTKILITGGAGYIGSHIAEQLVTNKKNVIILDNDFRCFWNFFIH